MLTSLPPGAELRAWHAPATGELQTVLEEGMRARYGAGCRVTKLERRLYAYASSFALEELEVLLGDSRRLRLIFKDIGDAALLSEARRVKPNFVRDSRREIEVYRAVLPGLDLGTADCYAAVSDESAGRFWLFLERVSGVELGQIGELETWRQVGRWLGAAHACLAERRAVGRATGRLLQYDADYFRSFGARARAFAPPQSREAVDRVVDRYEAVIELLTTLPLTIVHGDFYASNILVGGPEGAMRVCPIDWEMAGIGPALLDVAALTAGSWTDAEREEIVDAYRQTATADAAWTAGTEAFDRALDCCRLHIAVQWLGWSADWSPPAGHRQDWLGEALRLVERLSA
jgi:Ser/Thr protein kinase RdoA (MazF antagonist)